MTTNETDPSFCQPELSLRTARTSRGAGGKRDAAVLENNLRELEQLLRGRTLTRREIYDLRPDWRDTDGRYLRKLVELSGKIVSGPGTPGYRLADDTTIDDPEVDAALRHAANATISQMRCMARRVRHFRRTLGLRKALRETMEGRPS